MAGSIVIDPFEEGLTTGVDLTALGTTDWWYLIDGTLTGNRKATGGSVIVLSALNSTFDAFFNNTYPRTFSFTDGTSPTSGTSDFWWHTFPQAIGDGWRFVVPADTTPRQLKLFFGNSFNQHFQVEATLSDGSFGPVILLDDTFIDGAVTSTITYNAASGGQTLTVDLTAAENFGGVLTPAGVTLGLPPPPPLIPGWDWNNWKLLSGFFDQNQSIPTPDPEFRIPLLGVNIGALGDFGRQEQFTDLMPVIRAFSDAPFSNTNVATDSDGWPTAAHWLTLPQIFDSTPQTYLAGADGDLSTVVWYNQDGWTMSFTYDSASNRSTGYFISPGDGSGTQPTVDMANARKTNGSAAGTGYSNLIIRRPSYPVIGAPQFMPNASAYATSRFYCVRFLDWLDINENLDTSWTARSNTVEKKRVGQPPTTHETVIAFGNTYLHGKRLWTHVPVAYDDTAMTEMVQFYHDNVDPEVEVVYELQNEIGNSSFVGTGYVLTEVCLETKTLLGENAGTSQVIASASRTGSTVTITGAVNHNLTNGQSIQVAGFESVPFGTTIGPIVVVSPTVYTFTLIGTAGPITTFASTILMGDWTTSNLVYDDDINVYELVYRWSARRTCQMSDIIRGIYGDSAMMVRASPILMPFQGDGSNPINYILANIANPPSHYIKAIGNASYTTLDASPVGGPNLFGQDSYNGNTPPSIADIQSVLNLTTGNLRNIYHYDTMYQIAKTNNLQLWHYEGGPDTTGPSDGTTHVQTLAALFDTGYQPIYTNLLANAFRSGHSMICAYAGQIVDLDNTSQFNCWALATSETDPTSPRLLAMDAVNAGGPIALNRNPVPGFIDGRLLNDIYFPSGPTGDFPGISNGLFYPFTVPAPGTMYVTVSYFMTTTDTSRYFRIQCNGTDLGERVLANAGENVIQNSPTLKMTVTQGINELGIVLDGGAFIGNLVAVSGFLVSYRGG